MRVAAGAGWLCTWPVTMACGCGRSTSRANSSPMPEIVRHAKAWPTASNSSSGTGVRSTANATRSCPWGCWSTSARKTTPNWAASSGGRCVRTAWRSCTASDAIARTLEDWLHRFERHEQTVRRMYDEEFVRTWRLYLCGSIAAFRTGVLQLFQVVFTHRENHTPPLNRVHILDGFPIRQTGATER